MIVLKQSENCSLEHRLQQKEQGMEILEECLRRAQGSDDAEQTLTDIITYLGEKTGSDRAFLFEKSSHGVTVSNTVEWCRPGVRPQKALLQNLPENDISMVLNLLETKGCMLVDDIECLRQREPLLYACLQPQGIHSSAAARVMIGDELKGFWGFDNPRLDSLPVIRLVLKDLERIISAQVRQGSISSQLRKVDLRDFSTGFYNYRALHQHLKLEEDVDSMGVLYARLEQYKEGDPRIREIGKLNERICAVLHTRRVYRISPYEFAAVYTHVDRARIDRRRRALRAQAFGPEWKLRVGSSWSDHNPQLDDLLRDAVRWSFLYGNSEDEDRDSETHPLVAYIQQNHFDLEFFLDGITRNNDSACFFFGDVQDSVFFISDNMRKKFGFSGCLVPELMYAWADRIDGHRAQKRYWKDLRDIVEKKQDSCNLYHQVIDAEGHREWLHLYCQFKWNDDRTEILFCTGRLSMQDKSLAVDYETHFSLETVLTRHLARIKQADKNCYFIGFSFNSIAKINDMEGRAFGNSLIRSIAEELSSRYYDRAAFYKLSGMRFVALIRPEFESVRLELIQQIRDVIEAKYEKFGIQVPNACSMVLTQYPQKGLEPLDFVENITSCIKLVQQEGGRGYMDGTALDIERVRANANLSLELSRDVLSQMRNFRMVVQPVVDTRNSRIKGGEALLRWRNNGKDISPGFFIPILEQENMMIPVGRWVFEESVKACRKMLSLDPEFRLSINVSLQQLEDGGFTGFIERTIEKYQVEGRHLVLEMTESCMDTAQEKLMQLVLFCTKMGITVSLDDFGTGYSSLRVLMQYPTAIIKLDRSLLLEMGKSMDKKNFISSIVYACHQFGKQVCIEGVETDEQNKMVQEACCDMIQGFYYYRPMELDAVCELLARQKRDREHPEQNDDYDEYEEQILSSEE